MSLETLNHDQDDYRQWDTSVERLNKMFEQPSAPATDRTDEIDVSEARIGEFAPSEEARNTTLHPARLGEIGLRHAPYRPHAVETFSSS